MPDFDWQNLVTIGLVAIAASYLAFRVWPRRSTKSNGCGGGCSSCPSSTEKADEPRVVAVEELARSPRTSAR